MALSPASSFPTWLQGTQLAIVAAFAVSIAVVWWLDRSTDRGIRRRERLLLGVPWGTVVSILLVLGVYLTLQGGFDHWYDPVTIPYRAWTYLYPLGMVVAPFAHQGVGHLIGNLAGTLVLGSLAEYAWGHFPRDRGVTTFSSAWTNPYVRAFGLFPAAVVVIGLVTSLLSWGPIIGFSGVVFAFAGFALTRYPLLTVVALSADDVVRLVYRGLTDPRVIARGEPQFITPWWAEIAVQGHVLGLFLGLLVGVLTYRRRDRPSPLRVWAATLIAATTLSIWAVWWLRDNGWYVLYRWLGIVLVVAIALLVAVSLWVDLRDRPVLGVPGRHVSVLLLVFPVLIVGFAAVPLNLTTVADTGVPGDGPGVTVRDYTVTYAENVTNEITNVVNVSVLGETTRVRTSGVIVVSPSRHIWTTDVTTGRLAFAGTVRVTLGGPGWREHVTVRRRGWSVVGAGPAYRVLLKPPGADWRTAFRSDPATAEPVIAGKQVGVRPTDGGFLVRVIDNESVVEAALPARNESVTLDGITIVREGSAVFATHNETRVKVAAKEQYH